MLNRRTFLANGCKGLAAVPIISTGLYAMAKPQNVISKTQSQPLLPPEYIHSAKLNGFDVSISRPKAIVSEKAGHCYFPDLLRFSTGEFFINYNLSDDSNYNTCEAGAVKISNDCLKSFSLEYDLGGFPGGAGTLRMPIDGSKMLEFSYVLKPIPNKGGKAFYAHRALYENAGKKFSIEPWSAVIEGFPEPVANIVNPNRTRSAMNCFMGDIIRVGKKSMLANVVNYYESNKEIASLETVISHDLGYNWKYLSTIASPKDTPDAEKGEGCDEACMIKLKNGDLVCITRVGNYRVPLARSYSSDEGKTWSKIERLNAFSVMPQICELANETFVLASGRPGTFIWLSDNPLAKQWQSFDLINYHNSVMPKEEQILLEGDNPVKHQTTSYTAMIEVSPNRIFLVYDRMPFGWSPIPPDSGQKGQIFLVDISIART
jgi:hypothetical protein